MPRSVLEALLLRLAAQQVARPWWVVLLIGLSLLPAGWLAANLPLRTSISELLPDDKPSVVEMRRVNERLPGNSTLTVVATGRGADSLKRFVDALAPRIRALGPDLVASVDAGPRTLQEFFRDHKHLYADLADIRRLHEEVITRYDYEVSRASGMDLGLDEDEPPRITASDIEARFASKVEQAKKSAPGVDGYYIGEGGKLAAILVRTPFQTGDARAFTLRQKIESIIAEVNARAWDPSLEVGFTGNLITSAEQHRVITQDLTEVGIWGVALILAAVFFFFLRFRTLLAMALTIGIGCTWAFGLARLTVGHLNTATGFLVSIIAGNGINFGIIYMARYIEARRDEHQDVASAIVTAHRGTHAATLAAAGAAMIAYGSLSATDFRGFKHFGVIGGSGMVLCWVATYLFLPALLVLSERVRPMFTKEAEWRRKLRGVYGYPFGWVAREAGGIVALLGLLAGVVAAVLAVRYFVEDPMEYNLRNVGNEQLEPTSAAKLSLRVDKIVGRLGQDGKAIVVDRLDQVEPLVSELESRRANAPKDKKPFEKVVSIYDLVPKEQDEKLKLLAVVKDRIERARRRGFIGDAEWARLEQHIPRALEPVGIKDLPEQVARPFEEKDGTRGRIVYIVPTAGRSVYNAHYLMRWADSFREVRLPNGDVIRGTGDPVIFSDMLISVGEDAPRAIALSFAGTLVVMLVAFRRRASSWLALVTLMLGLSWLLGFLAMKSIKLNFLNFVALPISIGVGADYALNVLKRHEIEGDAQLYRVLVETGGAVVLCSLTTVLGYMALLLSMNKAVQSFGLVAAAGEVTTLLSAVLVLPSYLFWKRGRAERSASR